MTFKALRPIAAALAAFFMAGCAVVGGKSDELACAGPEWEWAAYRQRIADKVPGAAWVELTSDERKAFIGRMNKANEPNTGFAFSRVGYFKTETSMTVLLVYIVGDCVWSTMTTTEFQIKTAIILGMEA
jgi:hypothetical protein